VSKTGRQDAKYHHVARQQFSINIFFLLERKISAHPVPTYEYKNTGRHIKEKRFRIRVIPYF